MALANVERAHDQAVASCQASQASWTHASLASCIIGERITEPSSQLVVKEPEPAQEEARDKVAVRAKLAAHQQAAMKIVAQHMIQQVDAANAHHERFKSRLSVQLAELGPTDTSMDQRVRRRSIERQIKAAERVHAGQLEALEEKVCGASFEHIPECVHRNRHPPHALCTKSPAPSTMPPLCPQASVALSHVEEQHQRALAKLKQETQSEVGSIASTRMSAGNVSLGTDDPVQGSATLQAEALEEWSQLEDKKKDQMRAEAQKLTARMRSKQVEHEQAITAARARADKATSEAARARFEDEIREKEAQHARELQNLEAQASRLPPPPPPTALSSALASHHSPRQTHRQRSLSPLSRKSLRAVPPRQGRRRCGSPRPRLEVRSGCRARSCSPRSRSRRGRRHHGPRRSERPFHGWTDRSARPSASGKTTQRTP